MYIRKARMSAEQPLPVTSGEVLTLLVALIDVIEAI